MLICTVAGLTAALFAGPAPAEGPTPGPTPLVAVTPVAGSVPVTGATSPAGAGSADSGPLADSAPLGAAPAAGAVPPAQPRPSVSPALPPHILAKIEKALHRSEKDKVPHDVVVVPLPVDGSPPGAVPIKMPSFGYESFNLISPWHKKADRATPAGHTAAQPQARRPHKPRRHAVRRTGHHLPSRKADRRAGHGHHPNRHALRHDRRSHHGR